MQGKQKFYILEISSSKNSIFSLYKASLVYRMGEFQDSQGCTEKPYLENKTKTTKNNNKNKNSTMFTASIKLSV